MKNRRKILSICLSVLLMVCLFAVMTISISAATEPTLSINFCNLSFRDSVCIKYAVYAENVTESAQNVKLLIWNAPQEEYTVGSETTALEAVGTETISGKTHIIFDYTDLTAKQMTDVVYARAYVEVDGTAYYSNMNKYSILQYAYSKIGKTGTASTDQALVDMLNDMLRYGASAQKYFKYRLDSLATDEFYQISVAGGIISDGSTSGLYKSETKLSITATEMNDEGTRTFIMWADENGKQVGTTATIEITVGSSNAKYKAIYKVDSSICEHEWATATDSAAIQWGKDNAAELEKHGLTSLRGADIAASCYEKGYLVEYCEMCGSYNFTVTPATSHDYTVGDDTITEQVAPTCTTPGGLKVYCNNGCGSSELQKITPSTGHNYAFSCDSGCAAGKCLDCTHENRVGTCINEYVKPGNTAATACGAKYITPENHDHSFGAQLYYYYMDGENKVEMGKYDGEISCSVDYYLYKMCECSGVPYHCEVTESAGKIEKDTEKGEHQWQIEKDTIVFANCYTQGSFKVSCEYCNTVDSRSASGDGTYKGKEACQFIIDTYSDKVEWFEETYEIDFFNNEDNDEHICNNVEDPTANDCFREHGHEYSADDDDIRDLYYYYIVGEENVDGGIYKGQISCSTDYYLYVKCHNEGCTYAKDDSVVKADSENGTHTFEIEKETMSLGNSDEDGCIKVACKFCGAKDEGIDYDGDGTGDGVYRGEDACRYIIEFYSDRAAQFEETYGIDFFNSEDNSTHIHNKTNGTTEYDCFVGPGHLLSADGIEDTIYYYYILNGERVEGGIYKNQISCTVEYFLYKKCHKDGCDYVEDGGSIPASSENGEHTWKLSNIVIGNCDTDGSFYVTCTFCNTVDNRDANGDGVYVGAEACRFITDNYSDNPDLFEETYGIDFFSITYNNRHIHNSGDGTTQYDCFVSHGHYLKNGKCLYCELSHVSEGLEFTSNGDGTCYVSGIGECKDIDIVIPDTSPEGDKVIAIGAGAFNECKGIRSVVIPSTVVSIEKDAFSYCEALVSVVIPEGVETICEYAFYSCTALVNVEISNTVTSIGNCAFKFCESLTKIYIPDSVISVGKEAFSGCSALETVVMSNNVTRIEEKTFANCTLLSDIILPENVTFIGKEAFSKCVSLTSINIPKSVATIGGSAFTGCTGLKDVYVADLTAWLNISFGDGANAHPNYGGARLHILDENGNDLAKITIPNTITKIPSYSFAYCTSLVSVVIPESVSSIGSSAFYGCYKLVEVINKSSLRLTVGSTTNGYAAYYAKEVHDGESKIVDKNGYLFYTYEGTNYLLGYVGTATNLVLPADYDGDGYEIYKWAFYGNNAITGVIISSNVTVIGDSAFRDCYEITSVTIQNVTVTIGDFAFAECKAITKINYDGTKAQWSGMSKGADWNFQAGKYIVYCTDGNMSK